MSCGATALITAAGAIGRAIEMPMPAISSGSTKGPYAAPVEASCAIQVRPIAWTTRPAIISGRRPIRSDSRPAIGETTNGVAVQGSRRKPASSGE